MFLLQLSLDFLCGIVRCFCLICVYVYIDKNHDREIEHVSFEYIYLVFLGCLHVNDVLVRRQTQTPGQVGLTHDAGSQ